MSWFRALSLMFLACLAACASNPDDAVSNGPASDTADATSSWEADFSGLSAAQLDAALSAGLARCSLFASFAFVYSDMDAAITEVYLAEDRLTPDQGGTASTTEFCEAVASRL